MPVYLIIDIAVIDQEVYGEYEAQIPAVIEQYGGRYLVRGGGVVSHAGDWHPERIILIEFDTLKQVQECFDSPEYLALAPLREQSTRARAIVVEGEEP